MSRVEASRRGTRFISVKQTTLLQILANAVSLFALSLCLQHLENNTGDNNANKHKDDEVRTGGLLVLFRLHNLLQTLLDSGHSLIHVVINTIDNRTLLNDELVQILENLGKLLSALGYALVEERRQSYQSAGSPALSTGFPCASCP